MSFEFFIDNLSERLDQQLRHALNNHLTQIDTPDFLGPLRVTHASLGRIAPELSVVDIREPLAAFCHNHHGGSSRPTAFASSNNNSISAGTSSASLYAAAANLHDDDPTAVSTTDPVAAGSGGDGGGGYDAHDAYAAEDDEDSDRCPTATTTQQSTNTATAGGGGRIDHSLDTQFDLELDYSGDARLSIETELRVNYPVPGFLALPVRLTIRDIRFVARVAIAYVGDAICVTCLPRHITVGSGPMVRKLRTPHLELSVDSQTGDTSQGHPALHSIARVEQFLVSQLHEFVNTELTYPSYQVFLLPSATTKNDDEMSASTAVSTVPSSSSSSLAHTPHLGQINHQPSTNLFSR